MLEKMTRSVLAIAATAAVAGMVSGCQRSNASAPKPMKLSILSDRECIPPPFASPSQLGSGRGTVENVPAPATIKGNDANDDIVVPQAQDNGPVYDPSAVQQQTAPVLVPAGTSNIAEQPKAAPAEQAKPARTYKVQKGDSLSVIAYMYKITWQDLAAENNLTGKSMLKVGQTLKLPAGAAESPRPRPVIKQKPAPAKTTAAKPAAQSKPAAKPATPVDVYEVKSGDNLWLIAKRFGMKGEDIRALNPQIKDFAKLQVGDKLNLRASGKQEATPANKEAAPAAPVAPVAMPAEVTDEPAPAAPVIDDAAPIAPELPPAPPVVDEAPAVVVEPEPVKPAPVPVPNVPMLPPSPANAQ